MPDIIVMLHFWMGFSDPLFDLFVPVSDKNTNLQAFPFQKFHEPMKALLFHVVASTNFIALK